MLNLSCSAKSTSTGSVSATALDLEAILGNCSLGGQDRMGWIKVLVCVG